MLILGQPSRCSCHHALLLRLGLFSPRISFCFDLCASASAACMHLGVLPLARQGRAVYPSHLSSYHVLVMLLCKVTELDVLLCYLVLMPFSCHLMLAGTPFSKRSWLLTGPSRFVSLLRLGTT